jgi:hypothetical protein
MISGSLVVVSDVLLKGAIKKHRLLPDNSKTRSEIIYIVLFDVLSIQNYGSPILQVKSQKKLNNSRFSTTRRSNKRYFLAWFDFNRNIFEDVLVSGVVAKSDIV